MAATDDPFYGVKEDVTRTVGDAARLYERHSELLRQLDQSTTRQEREWICVELRNVLRSVEWDLDDLEQTLSIVEKNPRRWRLDELELVCRRQFVSTTRATAEAIKNDMATVDSRFRDRSKLSDVMLPEAVQAVDYVCGASESASCSTSPSRQYKYTKLKGAHANDSVDNTPAVHYRSPQQLILANPHADGEHLLADTLTNHDTSNSRLVAGADTCLGLNDDGEQMGMLDYVVRGGRQTSFRLSAIVRKFTHMTRRSYLYILLVVVGLVLLIATIGIVLK